MKIIIVKANSEFFKIWMNVKTLNIISETKHTVTVKLSTKAFLKLRQTIIDKGHNPYALMSW